MDKDRRPSVMSWGALLGGASAVLFGWGVAYIVASALHLV